MKAPITLGAVSLVLCTPAILQAAPPATDGQVIFRQRCQACHSDVAGVPAKVGPNLSGVVGRKAASTQFNYSPALKGSGLSWSQANLDKFLAAPAKVIPGTRMVIALPDPAQRNAVIAYLAKKH